MADAVLSVELQAQIRDFVNGMRNAASETQRTEGIVTKATKGISNAVTSTFAGVFSVAAIAGFTKEVIKVTAEFEKFQAVLGNTLGSQALADLKLKELQEFATKTPFGVQELTASFVKLANSGFKPTGDQMTKLGDLASSTGKSFDQLAEAIIDAQTGEFERLKEFGVRAKDAGDKVIFTYKGVQTQVEKTSGSIRDYITSLGDAEGVSGSMAKISETLGGKISNLGDSWDQMLLSVGSNTSGVFNSAINVMSKAIQKITQYNEDLKIAEEFNVGSKTTDFFQRLKRAVIPFTNKGATDLELATQGVKDAREAVSKFVSEATSGAKSADDFGKAMAGIRIQGDKALKSFGIVNEGERAGIADAYKKGVRAIYDARKAFLNQDNSDANFGDDKAKKSIKTISDILKDLDQDLLLTSVQFKATFDDTTRSKIGAYQSAINSLVKLGVDPASESVTKLKKAQQDLFQLENLNKFVSANTGIKNPALDNNGKQVIRISSPVVPDILKTLTPEQEKALKSVEKFNNDFNALVSKGLTSGIASIGAAFGEVLANGGNIFEALGASLLGSLGSVLTQLGEMSISVGVGLIGIKKALQSLNPAIAIAGGVALVALGALVSNKASSIGGKIQGGTSNRPTAFANGGIVSGPTLGLMGEYSGARNNPEVIAPLSKLKGMLGDTGGVTFIPSTTIKGEDIVIAFNRTNRRLGRV